MTETALKQRPAGTPVAAKRKAAQLQSQLQSQRMTERQAATARTATLLREILDYQERLNRLSVRSASDEDYLISAYRRQIERRQNQLNALPRPLEAAPNPWSKTY